MDEVKGLLQQLASNDESKRRRAAISLGEQEAQEAITALVQALRDASKGVQEAAIEALIKLRGRRTVKELIPLLRENDACLRNMAIEILKEVGRDGVDLLLALLKDKNGDVRIFTSDILGYTGEEMATEGLIELLNDPVANVRNQAIVSLGQLKDKKAISALLKALEKGDEWTKFVAIEALSKLGAEEIIDPLINYLQDENELVRKASLEALGKTGHPKAIPYLVRALKEADQGMKKGIIRNLMGYHADHLNASLKGQERKLLLNELFENLDEDDLIFNFRVIEIVGRLQDRRAVAPLIKLLENPNGLMKIAACKGLGLIGEAEALQYLLPLTEVPDEDLRLASQEAVERIRGNGKG